MPAKPITRQFFLAIIRYRNQQFLLCQHKHRTFSNARECIHKNRTDLISTRDVRIIRVTETLEFAVSELQPFNLKGEERWRSEDWSATDIREHFYNGSQMTVPEMQRLIDVTLTNNRKKKTVAADAS